MLGWYVALALWFLGALLLLVAYEEDKRLDEISARSWACAALWPFAIVYSVARGMVDMACWCMRHA